MKRQQPDCKSDLVFYYPPPPPPPRIRATPPTTAAANPANAPGTRRPSKRLHWIRHSLVQEKVQILQMKPKPIFLTKSSYCPNVS